MGKYTGFNSIADKLKMVDELSEYHNVRIKNALKKMEEFLISDNVVDTAKDIKKMKRIEIKGIDKNGKERRLIKDIQENFDVDMLEESEGYNTFFPIFNEGIIKCKTNALGTYYTQFEVTGESEEYFDLEIREYRFFNEVFYIDYLIRVEGISKRMPMCEFKTRYGTIQNFFVDYYSRTTLKDFTDDELNAIQSAIPTKDIAKINVDAIITYTLSTFRVANFLKEHYTNLDDNNNGKYTFYDNEYFVIKNGSIEEKTHRVCPKEESIIDDVTYIGEILNCRNGFKILKANTIEKVIQNIVQKDNITNFYAAVGFAFRSGLDMLETVFENVHKNKGNCEMIIGALQKYDDERANNKIDRDTVRCINQLLQRKNIQIYTYKPAFYHGKFYYMCSDDKAYVITGSSNISKTAFLNNCELDVIHILDRGNEQDRQFIEWYDNLRERCERIEKLDEYNFCEYNWTSELDAFHSLKNQRISKEVVKERIAQLDDEDTKFRLNLWVGNNPTDIYEDIDIDALKDYIMFVFASKKLVVFESFVPGNAYYVFRYRSSLVDLMADIVSMTKTQMACSIHYVNRGYHVQYKEKLKSRINKFFI